jgi:hypothetical protein
MELTMPDFFDNNDDRIGENKAQSSAIAIKREKLKMMRIEREKNLMAIFPADLDPGTSLHVISSGDIDALSYLIALADRYGPFDHLYASTWTLSREDCHLLQRYLTDKTIARLVMFTGEYFASRETSVYATLMDVVKHHPGSQLHLFKNHCKLLIMANKKTGFYAVCEGSANFTTNPRTEQTVITRSKSLHDFYIEWFEELLKK